MAPLISTEIGDEQSTDDRALISPSVEPAVGWLRYLAEHWWGVVLPLLGISMIVTGYQKWEERKAPERVVTLFVEALRKGDRATVLKLLTPQQSVAARENLGLWVEDWGPTPNLNFKILGCQIDRDFAIVHLCLIEDGYMIKPEVGLDRLADGRWRIAEISNLSIDPRWFEEQRKKNATADEKLAQELESVLKDQPGVLVERESYDHPRRL